MALRKRTEEKILDLDASMQGTLNFKEPVNLRINGKFEGTLETKGNLTIGENAIVNANIIGDNIIIGGKVKGKVVARERLTLLPTAFLQGEIAPAKLNVAEGAIIEGTCSMLHENFSIEELARYLEVDINSIIEWVNAGKIPAKKEGDTWRFERKEIDNWVLQGKLR